MESMAYVSLSVNSGSFNDPPNRYGLAHFCEHMLFMGSAQYPNEDAYSNHISEHSGYCNAFTQLEMTNFNFEISFSGLEKALDMMAWSLHHPLFDVGSVNREIKAIESEYKMNSGDDIVCMLQVLQNETTNKDHIFNRFMWGNAKSLRGVNEVVNNEELVNQLKAFFID